MTDRTRWFDLAPADAWFFRDGRPSNRGEDQSDLASLFPPHATTVVGALRAALARQQGWAGRGPWPAEIGATLGDGFDDLGRLAFTGPFLRKQCGAAAELLFPMPRHLLGKIDEEDDGPTFTPRSWLRPEPVACDLGDDVHLPMPPRQGDADTQPGTTGGDFFLTTTGMEAVIAGALPESAQCIHRNSLFTDEPRVGIAFDEQNPQARTTGEGAIYSPSYVRLQQGVSLAVGITGLPEDWHVPGILPLGGESRLATCRELPQQAVRLPHGEPDDQAIADTGRELLILLTPAHLTGGDSTDRTDGWIGPRPGEPAAGLHGGLAGSVLTAALDRPVRIGGWDFRKGPRPLEPFVPAGSVWWLEGVGGALDRLGSSPFTAYGYGHAIRARCPVDP